MSPSINTEPKYSCPILSMLTENRKCKKLWWVILLNPCEHQLRGRHVQHQLHYGISKFFPMSLIRSQVVLSTKHMWGGLLPMPHWKKMLSNQFSCKHLYKACESNENKSCHLKKWENNASYWILEYIHNRGSATMDITMQRILLVLHFL